VVARNYDPHCRPLHEAFGIQVVSSTSWGSQRLEELLYHSDFHTVYSAGNGEVEIYEFVVPREWQGKRLEGLIDSKELVAISITTAGRAELPTPDSILNEGDVVSVAATLQGVQNMRALITGH
jgi:trk system potassium uptake protein TrkA